MSGGGTFTLRTNQGVSKVAREKLMDDVKACEMARPSLALGNTDANGGWSFITHDDTVWPYVYRCMKERGHQPDGVNYSETSNLGAR